MKTLEEIKKEFEKFWTDLFGGEYDGTHPQGQIWNFIESTISQTKQELVEEIEKLKDKDCGWTGHGVLAHHIGTYEQIQASKDYAYKKGVDDVLELLEKLSNK